MTEQTTILVAIRYPLTDKSARTLAAAERLAHDIAHSNLTVLHVNLYQNRDHTQKRELEKAISSILSDTEASIAIRQGFLIEQEILKEAVEIGADIVVVGANQQSIWRRILHRLLRNDLEIGTFLLEKTTSEIEIIEVDPTVETCIVRSAYRDEYPAGFEHATGSNKAISGSTSQPELLAFTPGCSYRRRQTVRSGRRAFALIAGSHHSCAERALLSR